MPTDQPTREALIAKLLAFVSKLAAETKCDEAGTHCDFDSGPYCSEHGTLHRTEFIDEARELLPEVAAMLASDATSQPPTLVIERAAWLMRHVDSGHTINRCSDSDVCSCGAVFWRPAPQGDTPKDQARR